MWITCCLVAVLVWTALLVITELLGYWNIKGAGFQICQRQYTSIQCMLIKYCMCTTNIINLLIAKLACDVRGFSFLLLKECRHLQDDWLTSVIIWRRHPLNNLNSLITWQKDKLIIKNGYTYKELDEQADMLSGSGSCVGCRLEDY